jgi:hypothetical protein
LFIKLFFKLQALIDETHQNRVRALKSINEKEIQLINKSAHEEIKLKKKKIQNDDMMNKYYLKYLEKKNKMKFI